MIYYEFYFLYFKIIYYTSYSNAVITDNLTFLYANPRTLLFPLVDKNMLTMYGIIRQKHIQKEFFLCQSAEIQPESCIIRCFCVSLPTYK